MKKKNPKPMAYSKKKRSRGLKGRSLYVSLIIVAIAAVGLVYGYRALTGPPETETETETETAAEAFTPESNQASSAADPTAKQEAQPEQDKATSVQTEVQTNSSVKATVSPTKSSTKSRIETPLSPASVEDARELVEDLVHTPPIDTRSIKQWLRELVQQGELAVPAIREFLDSREDGDVAGSGDRNTEDYRPVRLALLDVLNQIGGDEALEVMDRRLQSTADPEEIALLAKGMEAHAPEMYREDILTAAREALAQASQDEHEVGSNFGALAPVFAANGDESVLPDLEVLYPQWKTLSMMALAELPEGAGIPSLISIAEDPQTAPNDRTFAWQMLAQASRAAPEAAAVLVDMAQSDQISSDDFIKIASTLGGKESRFNNELADYVLLNATKSANLLVISHTLNAPSTWSDGEIDQRLELIDEMLGSISDPVIDEALNRVKASLSEWREIPYIEGTRKKG